MLVISIQDCTHAVAVIGYAKVLDEKSPNIQGIMPITYVHNRISAFKETRSLRPQQETL